MATKPGSTSDALSITGLSTEAQEVIAKAARKQRRSVNAWASSALKNAAQAALADGSADHGIEEVLTQIKQISRKLDRISARPNPAENILNQVQARLHEMGDRLGTVFDEVRERGGETMDEVREHGSDITEKAGETFSQWLNVADRTIKDLQRNLNDLQKTVIGKAGLAPAQKRPAAADKKISAKKPARPQSASGDGPPKTRKKNKQPTTKKKSLKSRDNKKMAIKV